MVLVRLAGALARCGTYCCRRYRENEHHKLAICHRSRTGGHCSGNMALVHDFAVIHDWERTRGPMRCDVATALNFGSTTNHHVTAHAQWLQAVATRLE